MFFIVYHFISKGQQVKEIAELICILIDDSQNVNKFK